MRFALTHKKREIFNLPAVKTYRERIFQLFGNKTTDTLIAVDFSEGGRRIFGHVSRPPGGRGDRAHQYSFINSRPVRDRTMQAAISQAFRGFLEKDRFPECWLYLTLPFNEVDVNVHPAKSEVRFDDSSAVFRLVKRGIELAIFERQGLKDISLPAIQETEVSYWIKDRKTPPAATPRMTADGNSFPSWERSPYTQDLFHGGEEARASAATVLGQYKNAYIIAGDPEGLLIIDQHNAHERVLFEEYRKIKGGRSWPRKMSLMPLVFELSPSQLVVFEEQKELLEESGFSAESMGGRSVALKEYPDIFKEAEARDVFFSLLEELGGNKIEDRRRLVLATMACRSAVKYGEPLPRERMAYLVERLFQTDNPSLCPHGRPIIIRISNTQIEKGLKRR